MKQLLVSACVVMVAGILGVSGVQAQDLMFLKNVKEPVKVKISEIGIDEIKYKPWGDDKMPVLVIPRASVTRILMETGAEFSFKDNPMTDQASYAEQRRNAIKLHFLSPMFGHTAFSYERSVKPGKSVELGLGVIGLGMRNTINAYKNPSGYFLRAGFKFINTPSYYTRGMRYSHVLKGEYLKPELIGGTYGVSYDMNVYNPQTGNYSRETGRKQVNFAALLLNIGKQWVFDDVVLFDLYGAVGYGISNYDRNFYTRGSNEPGYESYYYGFAVMDSKVPLAISGGLKIGLLFGRPPVKEKVK